MTVLHGMYGTPTYVSWRSMMTRCEGSNHMAYKYYGSRRIRVCKRWHKFNNFLKDMGVRPKGKTIDRIDNDKGYMKKTVGGLRRQNKV